MSRALLAELIGIVMFAGAGAYYVYDINDKISDNTEKISQLDSQVSKSVEIALDNPDFRNKIRGDTGPQGPKGEQGQIGPIGLTGPRGQQGVQGPPGQTGLQGSSPNIDALASAYAREVISTLRSLEFGDRDVTACMVTAALAFPTWSLRVGEVNDIPPWEKSIRGTASNKKNGFFESSTFYCRVQQGSVKSFSHQ